MIPVHAARVLNRLTGLTLTLLITILTSKSAAPAEPLDWPAVVATFSNATTIVMPATGTIGKANLYPSTVNVSGFSGEVLGVTATLNGFSHTFADDIDILLVGPGGQRVLLMSDAGGSIDVSDLTLTFADGAAALPDFGPLVSGKFAPTNFGEGDTFPAPAPLAPYGTSLSDFNGTNPNGTWSLFVADDVAGDVGSIASGFTLTITATDVPTSANDAFTTAFQTPLSVAAPGVLANDNSNGGSPLTVHSTTGPSNGALAVMANGGFTYTPNAGFVGVDTFTYRAANSSGPGSIATVFITVQTPTVAQPPTVLRASSIVGDTITLRWAPPAIGPAPTEYLLEAGALPGEVLASIPTGSPLPILTFIAPTGSFYVRLRTIAGSISAPSNEIQVHVNVPVAPSAPSDLVGTVNGSNFNLAWRNTFGGGAPTQLFLDVSGSANVTLPIGLTDNLTFSGVPAGTYTMSLRASNAGGFSASSNAITLTFPVPCSGPPLTPINFLAYNVGSTVNVLWDPAATGPAPAGFVLSVSGSFVGNAQTTSRVVSATAPPGAYGLSVVAINDCGVSAATPIQFVAVP
jgi:subtilisin-like proprotein convertase family protein